MYEYKSVLIKEESSWLGGKFNPATLDQVLNDHGLEGWELAQIVPTSAAYGQTSRLIVIFKRESRF